MSTKEALQHPQRKEHSRVSQASKAGICLREEVSETFLTLSLWYPEGIHELGRQWSDEGQEYLPKDTTVTALYNRDIIPPPTIIQAWQSDPGKMTKLTTPVLATVDCHQVLLRLTSASIHNWALFFKINFVCVHVHAHTHAHQMCEGAQKSQTRASDPLELEFQVAVSILIWVLGTTLCLLKEASTHWASLPAPCILASMQKPVLLSLTGAY